MSACSLLVALGVEFSRPLPYPQPRTSYHPERKKTEEGCRYEESLPVFITGIEAYGTRGHRVREQGHEQKRDSADYERSHRYTFQ